MSISCWVNIDKPKGMSSAKAVSIVRSILKQKKVGHGGTLDPLAVGVLPIAVGEATKTVSFINAATKEYEFTIKFGAETDTYDEEGAIMSTSDKIPTEKEILSVIPKFMGDIEQAPPVFSAIKVNGMRAYELARAGEKVELNTRSVFIKSLDLLNFDKKANEAKFRVECGKGTYIRSLGYDLAKKAGSIGYIKDLSRTKVGFFNKKNLISLEKLEKIVHNGAPDDKLLSVGSVLDDIPAIVFSDAAAKKLLNGVKVTVDSQVSECESRIFRAKNSGRLLAVGEISNSRFVPMRIFNFNKEYYDVDY